VTFQMGQLAHTDDLRRRASAPQVRPCLPAALNGRNDVARNHDRYLRVPV